MRNCARNILPLLLFFLLTLPASAEQVRLKSGDIIRGTIIFQNEQVLVIKKADGSRFQYLQTDVEAILEDEAEEAPKEQATTAAKEKKVTVSLQFAGGMTVLPGNSAGSKSQTGGNVQADLFIGSTNLLGKRIFLSGGLGYHLHYAAMPPTSLAPVGAQSSSASRSSSLGEKERVRGKGLSFLPIQLRAEAPLTRGKHAPMLGLGVGYGISLQKSAKGGAFADFTFGWRCQLSDSRAISLGLFSNIQQTKLTDYTDIIDGNAFVAPSAGRAFFDFGIRFAAYL